MRIVFLLPRAFQPRYYRRVDAWAARGWEVTVYHFQRGSKDRVPDLTSAGVSLVKLGDITDGRYLRRLWSLLRALVVVRAHERRADAPSYVYCFGWDMAFLAMFASRRSGTIVEIGDTRGRGTGRATVIGAALQTFELVLGRLADAVILTSPGFVDSLLPSVRRKTAVIVHENKVPRQYATRWLNIRSGGPARTGGLRIGFVGLFRYPYALCSFLDAAAELDGSVSVELFGDGPLSAAMKRYSERYGNIRFHGQFTAPQDLPGIYSGLDVCYAVYDNRDFNVRIALPNKLYEAALFGVPILVASDTLLGARVEALGIGWQVDPRRSGWAREWLETVTPADIEERVQAALSLPLEELVSDEDALVERIISVNGRTA